MARASSCVKHSDVRSEDKSMNNRQTIWAYVWHQLERRPYMLLFGLYLLCLAIYTAAIPLPRVDGQLIGSDGVYYYAYLPTLFLDGDLDFGNQYARLLPDSTVAQMSRTPTGRLPNAYAVGPALLWAPFFLGAHALALLLQTAGVPISLDGTGQLYQGITLLGSLSYGFAGLMLIHGSCRRFFGPAASALTVALIWMATNVIYYMVAEPSMSHTCSLFAVALLLELWLASRPAPTLRQWVAMGLVGGVVALVRQPDVTYLAFPVLDGLLAVRSNPGVALRRQLLGVLVFGLASIVLFTPQMAVWQVLYGSPFISGYLYTDLPTFFWLQPKVVQVLFSPLHGLYLWHPLYLLATMGLVWLYRRDRRLAFWLGLGLAVQIYVIGAWRSWSQGDAFGGRMFISSLPGLALGLGALIEWAVGRGALVAVELVGAGLVIWNGLFLIQYRLGYIPMSAPINLEQFTVGKFWMLVDLWQRISKS